MHFLSQIDFILSRVILDLRKGSTVRKTEILIGILSLKPNVVFKQSWKSKDIYGGGGGGVGIW
jgi:hypothetical protein